MQNKVEINGDQLVVTPQGINKLASFQGSMTVPLKHVKSSIIDNEILNQYKGFRGPGTSISGYWAGTFTKEKEKTFFNIKKGNKPVVINLEKEKFTRLVLGVDQPESFVDLINNQIN